MADEIIKLRNAVREFIRLFGVLDNHRTPCGEPLQLSHAHALMYLHESAEKTPPRISDLGAKLSIDKANVSRLCRRMEEAGHIDIRPCPDDGRAKRVHLTDEGERVASRVDQSSRERFERLIESLDDEATSSEIAKMLEFLNRGLETLNANDESPNHDN